MTKQEFIEKYTEIIHLAILFHEKARFEGILCLQNELNNIPTTNDRDIFKYGLELVIDYIAPEHIEKILDNLINQTDDHDEKTLKLIQKEAVLAIQERLGISRMQEILNAYTDIPLEESYEIIKVFDDIPRVEDYLTSAESDTGILNIVTTLTNLHIQEVLRNCDQNELALSLLGSSDIVKEAFFRNVSPRAKEIIKEEMRYVDLPTLADIEAAQKRMIVLIENWPIPVISDTGMLNIIDFLTNEQIKTIFPDLEQEDLALSLLGASDTVRDAFFRNLSPRAKSIIQDDMAYMRDSTLADIKAAQKRIIALIKKIGE